MLVIMVTKCEREGEVKAREGLMDNEKVVGLMDWRLQWTVLQ